MTEHPFMQTQRLELWKPRASDLADMCRLVESEETRRFLGHSSPSPDNQFERMLRNAGGWALYGYGIATVRFRGGDGSIVASCGMFHSWRGFGKGMDDTPEAGWIVREDYWRMGIAREAMEAMLTWFDRMHGPRRIACMIEEGHDISDHLARTLGFTPYDRHEPEGDGDQYDAPLVLYERMGG